MRIRWLSSVNRISTSSMSWRVFAVMGAASATSRALAMNRRARPLQRFALDRLSFPVSSSFALIRSSSSR